MSLQEIQAQDRRLSRYADNEFMLIWFAHSAWKD
jgi:hypothetical protein